MGVGTSIIRAQPANRLEAVLTRLYGEQQTALGADGYLAQHSDPRFIAGQVKVFEWYRSLLPGGGAILDWGCRHAPDSCLIRTEFDTQYQLSACDLPPQGQYDVFHRYANLEYRQLTDVVRLPYEPERFDAVIGSGVLEHVAMDYESLKELYRITKPNGRLIITFLPNRLSWGEWRLRRAKQTCHRRLYSLSLIRQLLLRTGFYPLQIGYQTKLDQLPPATAVDQVLGPTAKFLQLHRVLASCLCVVAIKVDCM